MLLKRFSMYECPRCGDDLQMWSVDKIQNRWFYHENSLDVRYKMFKVKITSFVVVCERNGVVHPIAGDQR